MQYSLQEDMAISLDSITKDLGVHIYSKNPSPSYYYLI